MIYFNRKACYELLYFRALSYRKTLVKSDAKKLNVYERGLVGEQIYDKMCDEAGHENFIIFRDVYLKIEGTVTQYDSIIVSDGSLIVNEIKNFKGVYSFNGNKWFVGGHEIGEDPNAQLKRAVSKLVKLRYLYNINFNTSGVLVFPNDEFVLNCNDAAVWDSVVMRSNLRRYIVELGKLQSSRSAEELAEIISSHVVENPFFKEVADFSELRKGVYCRSCGSFQMKKHKIHFECLSCSKKDTVHTIVLQAISDHNALFRGIPITRKRLTDLLGGVVSKITLFRFMNKYCDRIEGKSRGEYRFKYYDFDDAYENEERLWRYKDY